MAYVTKFDSGERFTDLAELDYIKKILNGEISILSVQFSRGNNGKKFFYCLKLNLINDNSKEVYALYADDPTNKSHFGLFKFYYNGLFRLVEDVIDMPISEFTDRKFDYLC